MKIQNRDWVEIIPGRWKIGRISYMYHVQLGKMLQPEPKGIEDVKKPYLRSANLDWHGVKLDDVKEMWFSIQDLKKYKIEPGDILVSEGGDVGRTSFWDGTQELYIQNAINRLRPITEESNSKFLFYWFCFLKNHGLIDIICDSSTIAHYTAEKVKATQLVYPPFSEQTQIANFLDHKTGQIDRLIEQKEKLLKLLAEKRTAIITRAVTKGLDPNVEMKDSGIDWLGEIPKHWEVSKIGYDYDVQLGKMVQPEPKNEEEEFLPYLRAANIQWNSPNLTSVKSMWFSKEDKKKYNLKKGDLLISEGGDVGRSCMWIDEQEMYFQNALNRVRSIEKSNIEYLYYWMFFLKHCGYINITCNSSTIAHYTAEKVKATPIAIPDIEEQKNLVLSIQKLTKHIDKVINSIIKSIEKLKEYREALITAAVTGQIDVRGEMDIRDNDSTLGGANSHLEHPDIPFNEKHNAKI